MVKLKNRYILTEVLLDERDSVTETDIYMAINKQVAHLFGDFGVASAKQSLSIKVFDKATSICLVRISKEFAQRLLCAAAFVRSIGGAVAVLQTLFVGSSIRACQKALLRINRQRLYTSLRTASNNTERTEILKALKLATGSVNATNVQ